MKSYINVCDVEKYYGSVAGMTKAVDRVSFQVSEGEFVGVRWDLYSRSITCSIP